MWHGWEPGNSVVISFKKLEMEILKPVSRTGSRILVTMPKNGLVLSMRENLLLESLLQLLHVFSESVDMMIRFTKLCFLTLPVKYCLAVSLSQYPWFSHLIISLSKENHWMVMLCHWDIPYTHSSSRKSN